jgi:uncharacterized Tic20 family protein
MEENVKTPKPAKSSESGGRAEQNAGPDKSEQVQPAEVSAEVSKDARMWAMFCHLGGLAGYVMPIVGNVVAPLIVWQIKKDASPFVDQQGKEAVNFQISMSLYALICIPLVFIIVGAFLLLAVGIVDLVFLLIAAVKANNGQQYRYPLAIRFIK